MLSKRLVGDRDGMVFAGTSAAATCLLLLGGCHRADSAQDRRACEMYVRAVQELRVASRDTPEVERQSRQIKDMRELRQWTLTTFGESTRELHQLEQKVQDRKGPEWDSYRATLAILRQWNQARIDDVQRQDRKPGRHRARGEYFFRKTNDALEPFFKTLTSVCQRASQPSYERRILNGIREGLDELLP